ncbi:hypothetical protein IQ454_004900 [Salmonella enterica]|nr:hypothetical protein [Salmonella enterica]EGL4350823.1 hypothetical protein [Salmonella enterica]EGL4360072.1 hypothetical protein [Salmonella enterica]EGL4383017.1 hypothetical protein [Salmonella enterica]EGL4488294.1 hypothetical protein [Salmonella enterica]
MQKEEREAAIAANRIPEIPPEQVLILIAELEGVMKLADDNTRYNEKERYKGYIKAFARKHRKAALRKIEERKWRNAKHHTAGF